MSWRGAMFRVVAVLLAFVYLVPFQGLEAMLAPWVVFPDSIDHGWPRTPGLHRLGDAQSGALFTVLFAGCLLSLLRRPKEKPALVQFYAATSVFILLSSVPFGALNDSGESAAQVVVGTLVVFLVLVAPLMAAYPSLRSLPRLSGGSPISRPLLALGTPIAASLLV